MMAHVLAAVKRLTNSQARHDILAAQLFGLTHIV